MSTFNKLKNKVKSYAKTAGQMVKGQFGAGKSSDDSSRSEAAGQMMKRDVGVQRQAGGGQIKYTGQEDYMA